MNTAIRLSLAALYASTLWACTPPALAQDLTVSHAWIRPTVQGQLGTGGFMTLHSTAGLRITGVKTDADIGVAELHEMAMENGVMRMRAVPHLDIAPGKPFELKSGGHHLMLVDLKKPLPRDTEVPLTFSVQDSAGKKSEVKVQIKVASRAPQGSTGDHAAHKH